MSLFHELKRRNVFKVAASYAIVAWIVLQVVSTTSPALNIPSWVLSFVTVLVLLGFPLALFISWAYEMTPEGIKPTAEVPSDDSIRAQTGRKMNGLLLGAVVLLLVVVAVDAFVLDEIPQASVDTVATEAVAVPGNSIAVLPFANLSSDTEQEYFSDGLTEELLNQLAQVQGLQVAGRTSSFAFKGRSEDLRAVGEALGVAHLLEGSVRKSGNQLRITAQLVKADDGYHLWSQTYDRELTDIFAIQDEIAQAVTTALSITIGAGEFSRPGMTRNIDAYDAYLQALRHISDFSGAASVREAIDHIEQAVNLDPRFSRAWVLLITIYSLSEQFLTPEQRVNFPARIAEARAVVRTLTPDLPELQLISAAELILANRLVEAEQVLLNHLQGTGNSDAQGARLYGTLLMVVGRAQQALPYLQQARRLEPLEAQYSFYLIQSYTMLGRYDEASAEIERGLGLEGLDEYISGQRMLLAFQRNDPEETLRALELMEFTPEYNFTLANLWRAGDTEAALAEARRIVALPDAAGATHILIAQWAARLGDPQLSLDLRTRGLGAGATGRGDMISIWFPYSSELRKLPGFKDFARDFGLLDYWRSTGNWADLCRPVNDDFECF